MSSRHLVSILAVSVLPVGCSSQGTKPRSGTGGVAQTGGATAGGTSGTGGASNGMGGVLGTGGAAGSATSGRLDGGAGRDSSIAFGGSTGTGGSTGGGATGRGDATGPGGRTGLDGGASHGGATGLGGAGMDAYPDVGGTGGGVGDATAGGVDGGGGRDEWAEGEFRVCMGDEYAENPWARVYRYDAATASCIRLLFQMGGCSLGSGFLVEGPWRLCDAMVVPNVESCDDSTVPDPTPLLAESVTGSFSVSTDRLLDADLVLTFASGGPPDRSVKVSDCRLPHAGCSTGDCRQ
jgi:hypothetical protein